MSLPMTNEEIEKKIKNEVPIQTIADLNGIDIKPIEVDESTFREVERRIYACNERIEGLRKDISYYEEQIESWRKIMASIKKKEEPKNDQVSQ